MTTFKMLVCPHWNFSSFRPWPGFDKDHNHFSIKKVPDIFAKEGVELDLSHEVYHAG
jgi:hypothetical protein